MVNRKQFHAFWKFCERRGSLARLKTLLCRIAPSCEEHRFYFQPTESGRDED